MRLQERDGFLHGSRRAHHLRQEHLARAEERAHFCHAVHERTFDDAHRRAVDGKGFLEVGFEKIVNAFQQSRFQAHVQGNVFAGRQSRLFGGAG